MCRPAPSSSTTSRTAAPSTSTAQTRALAAANAAATALPIPPAAPVTTTDLPSRPAPMLQLISSTPPSPTSAGPARDVVRCPSHRYWDRFRTLGRAAQSVKAATDTSVACPGGSVKIRSIEAIRVSYPEPNDFDALRHLCLCRIVSDDGQVGWGEAVTQFAEASFATQALIEGLAPNLVGKDAVHVETLWRQNKAQGWWYGYGGGGPPLPPAPPPHPALGPRGEGGRAGGRGQACGPGPAGPPAPPPAPPHPHNKSPTSRRG